MSEVGNAQRDNAVPSISFFTDEYSIAASSTIDIAHGLPSLPREVWVELQCITAELGYTVGDHVIFPMASDTFFVGVSFNKTTIHIAISDLPTILLYDGSDTGTITADNWQLVVKAEV